MGRMPYRDLWQCWSHCDFTCQPNTSSISTAFEFPHPCPRFTHPGLDVGRVEYHRGTHRMQAIPSNTINASPYSPDKYVTTLNTCTSYTTHHQNALNHNAVCFLLRQPTRDAMLEIYLVYFEWMVHLVSAMVIQTNFNR